jgi:hypothetical protein
MCSEPKQHEWNCTCSACLARRDMEAKGIPQAQSEWAKGFTEGVKHAEARCPQRRGLY